MVWLVMKVEKLLRRRLWLRQSCGAKQMRRAESRPVGSHCGETTSPESGNKMVWFSEGGAGGQFYKVYLGYMQQVSK